MMNLAALVGDAFVGDSRYIFVSLALPIIFIMTNSFYFAMLYGFILNFINEEKLKSMENRYTIIIHRYQPKPLARFLNYAWW
jgi:hypothetical protein